MSRLARPAAVFATALALTAYIAVGHGFHAANDGMKSMHGPEICLVLFALAVGLSLAVFRERPPLQTRRVVLRIEPVLVAFRSRMPVVPARASPAWLQVFRH
jgi:hypothetical protein